MYKIVESPYINLKKNFFVLSTPKSLCDQLEQDIFNFINLIRQKPSKLIKYLTNNQIFNNNDDFDSQELINYIHNLSIKNKSFPPLLQKKELTKISDDLLNYIISIKTSKGEIKYDLMENREINLKKRALPNIKIKGKYYEGISLESNNLIEIISYIIKDNKGRNILFNEKIKYIGISCGIINNMNNFYNSNININNCKICSIIDLVEDFEKNEIKNNSHLIDKIHEYNMKAKPLKNKNLIIKSFSYDKITKRKVRRRKFNNNNFLKENTYDNILIKNKNLNNNSPLSNNEPSKEKEKEKIKSLKLFQLTKTPTNTDLNKIYKNNSFYSSKYFKIKNTLNKTEEKPKEKKMIDNISETSKSPSSFSRQRTKKKLKPEEKLELLRQINKENREKNSRKKSAIKIDDDSKSAVSFTTKKNNNISNDVSFSEIISTDNDKKKEKININKLKSELKQELKNEVKQELKVELENKMNINNDIKIPLLKLFLNQNDAINNNNNSINNNSLNNNNRETRGLENFASTNRSINSIDIFLPPNKNISAINDSEKDTIPGLININSNILNNDNNMNNSLNKKENVIIKKFVKLNGIKNLNKGNKTPDNTSGRSRAFIKNKSPPVGKQFVYHKIPFGNKNIFCNNINKKNDVFNLKINTSKDKNIIRNIYNMNSPTNKLNYFNNNSPRPVHKESLLTFKKIIVKNINNENTSKGNNSRIEKIIKFPKKIINNLNYIDNNRIIINNKTKNIVYIKQTSPNKMKTYDINNIYKKK